MPLLYCCKNNICHLTAVTRPGCGAERERVESTFSPALEGDKDDNRSWTAGVAILVRDSLGMARWTAGLQEPVTQFLDDGIAGIVTLLDGVAIAIASGYWFSSQGLKKCNHKLFSVVCQFASATTLDVIVGGDFQVEPALAQSLECFAMSGLVLKAADRSKNTCTSKFGGRCIDWFLMSASVGAAINQIVVRKKAFTRPHSPVSVTFKPRLSLLKKLVMDAPQKLPIEPIIGPLKPLPVAWNAGKWVRAAVQSARCDPSSDNADQALAEAYTASANLWEAEIRRITGAHTTTRKGLRRVTFPRMVWRPLEAKHWAQYGVKPGATVNTVTKFSTAILSFRQGHQVTEDCQSEDLIKLREEKLLLLDRLKQIALPWVSLWKNVVSGQGEEEDFQQMEKARLEELDECEVTARECIDMALKQNAIET